MSAFNVFQRFRHLRRGSQSRIRALQVLSSAFMLVSAIATAAPGLSAINVVTTTEYYYTPLDYYFITSRDSNKAALDGSSGWTRTGRSFTALSAPIAGYRGLTQYNFDNVAVKATHGNYAYYATRQFPYYLACYHGTATRQQ